jgi:stage V sporulation protein AE
MELLSRCNNIYFIMEDNMDLEQFIWAFVIGGLICVIGQVLMDGFKLTPAHTMCILVVAGAVLGGLGLYDPLVKFAGAGAFVPISSFGNALVKGALQEADQYGNIGVLTGIFEVTSAGISSAIIFGFMSSLVFKSKG